jgi:DNA-binding transcriptional ArsR family regulator
MLLPKILISTKIESMGIDMKKNCCLDESADKKLKLTTDFLKVIAEENRLKILCILLQSDEQCVCDIWKYLNLPQNLTSHHLKILKDFGLITSRKEGLNVFYSINHQKLKQTRGLLDTFLSRNQE